MKAYFKNFSRVLLAYQGCQVSPAQKEWEFLVLRFVPARICDLIVFLFFFLLLRCVFVTISCLFQGDIGFRGLPGLPGPPGEGLQGPPVRSAGLQFGQQ